MHKSVFQVWLAALALLSPATAFCPLSELPCAAFRFSLFHAATPPPFELSFDSIQLCFAFHIPVNSLGAYLAPFIKREGVISRRN